MAGSYKLNHGPPSNNKGTNNESPTKLSTTSPSPHSKDNGSLRLKANDQDILNSMKKEQGGGLSSSGSQKHGCWNAWLCSTCSRYSKTARWLLFWMCCAGAVQGMVVNGFVNTGITTIEKRFNMKSRSTGLISGFYDIASLVMSLPVSYMGSRPGASKPRWLGVGLIIMGVGSFVFTLPNFVAGPYDASAVAADGGDSNNDTVLCGSFDLLSSTCDDSSSSSWLPNLLYIFLLGQLMHGLGAVPIYTIGVAFIDESVSPHLSSLYLGIFYAMSVVGPALGYGLGGHFLGTYIDAPYLDPPAGILSSSDLWLGAWWIGFFVSGTLSLLVAIPMLLTPPVIPRDKEPSTKEMENDAGYADTVEDDHQRDKSFNAMSPSRRTAFQHLKDLGTAVRGLLRNISFIALSVSQSVEFFLFSGFASFLPKLLENQFGVSASFAGLLVGAIVIPAGGGGTLIGGWIVKKFRMKCHTMIKFCFVVSLLGLAMSFSLFLYCKNNPFAGVNVPYHTASGGLNGADLYSSCNSDCNCQEVSYNPVCGSDGVSYFSPCHAGCSASSIKDDEQLFSECSCVNPSVVPPAGASNSSGQGLEHLLPGQASLNTCPVTCDLLIPFLLVLFIIMFLVFVIATPTVSSSLRCVEVEHRSLALGVQGMSFRLFGSVPGPIVFGSVIDSTCVLWQEDCGTQGSCVTYDNFYMSRYFLTLGVVAKFVCCVSFAVAYWFYVPPKTGEATHIIRADHRKNGSQDAIFSSPSSSDSLRL